VRPSPSSPTYNSRTHASQIARPEATSPPCATQIAALVRPVQVLDAHVRAGGGVPAGGEKETSVVVVHVHVVSCAVCGGWRGPLPETTARCRLQVAVRSWAPGLHARVAVEEGGVKPR